MDDFGCAAMIDVFVSYSQTDRDRIALLVEGLERRNWSVYWDSALTAGERFRESLEDALNQARSVVVGWSSSSISSSFVRDEADIGRKRGVLVPVLIEAVEPPIGFRELHWVDLTGWNGQSDQAAFSSLVKAIEAKLRVPSWFEGLETGVDLDRTVFRGEYEDHVDPRGEWLGVGRLEFRQDGSRIVGKAWSEDEQRTWLLEGAVSNRRLCYVYIDAETNRRSVGAAVLELNDSGEFFEGLWIGWSPEGTRLEPQRIRLIKE